MSARRIRLTLLAAALAAAIAVPAALGSAQAQRLRVVGFSSHAGIGGAPPRDAVAPGTVLKVCRQSALRRLYAFVRYSGMVPGSPATITWRYSGDPLVVSQQVWKLGKSGATYFYLHHGTAGLDTGPYQFEVRSRGKVLARASISVTADIC